MSNLNPIKNSMKFPLMVILGIVTDRLLAPHNNNMKMLTKRIGEHKKANDGFVHSHKLLHTYATNAKHITKGHIEDLKRRGPFGVSDYRGDRAVTSVMKYNHQLNAFNKSPHEYEKAAKEHLSKIADED